uniref:BPL/LPL catalytic domain-containing protein n=1 Tax=Trieres chinensis TaxID=1514140 RepID=A0A7S1Z0V4_TRICV|mmetsp:Transcript_15227/g.31120  ORF Transcript_15227/g.31120 Transcript_15227/m.31120 type:complete len:361 (+) Transcript_15227:81-1163(+)
MTSITRIVTTTVRRAARAVPKSFSTTAGEKPKLSWLDLQGSGLSAVERLCLEEALLRHDPLNRCWGVVGNHDPTHHTRLELRGPSQGDRYVMPVVHNASCAIVMGIGGKPEKLLDVDAVREDGVQVIRRFSGGGTVVVDHSSLWTTFVGRTKDLPDVEPYPRPIMKWSADEIFGPAFRQMKEDMMVQGTKKKTLVMDTKSCGNENSGRLKNISFPSEYEGDIPDFELVETDYVLGELKMGGNAQAIVKGGWLHHTSFLWDYVDEHMNYLTLPEKQPDYRENRSHEEFLVKLKKYYGHLEGGKRAFFRSVRDATERVFVVEEVTLREVLEMMDSELGGFQEWYDGKCRTCVLELPDPCLDD